MPDRDAITRRRRRSGGSPDQLWSPSRELDRELDRELERDLDRGLDWAPDELGRRRRTAPHPLGIPRILGRRARWVGARLRREA